VATTFQGAETIKCGHGVYKVGWSLQSRPPGAGHVTTESGIDVAAGKVVAAVGGGAGTSTLDAAITPAGPGGTAMTCPLPGGHDGLT
jgi:hypothetical protein